jgi:4-diphosphocytidyl-2-C-methyl-D-erythritol kinase
MSCKHFAPAKINLSLHVTGLRSDGYHLLDSLVVFVDVGDEISAQRAPHSQLKVGGPFGQGVPTDDSNLVMKAAKLSGLPMALNLEKNLPPSSGIGGGSADAAATLRAAMELGSGLIHEAQTLVLGADVPVCLASKPARMRGVGDVLDPVSCPQIHMVLVNPGVAVSTPDVFKRLESKVNSAMPQTLPHWPDALAFTDWLGAQRNDLQTPAAKSAPEIAAVLVTLALMEGVRLTRMSGSGATCFAVFDSREIADKAAAEIAKHNPWWWVRSASTLPG